MKTPTQLAEYALQTIWKDGLEQGVLAHENDVLCVDRETLLAILTTVIAGVTGYEWGHSVKQDGDDEDDGSSHPFDLEEIEANEGEPEDWLEFEAEFGVPHQG